MKAMTTNELKEMKKDYNYEYTLHKEYEDDILDEFGAYDSGYICDIISEISDASIPFKTHELLKDLFAMQEWIDEAVFQLGMPGSEDSGIIVKLAQYGYYQFNTSILYNNLDELINNYVIDYIIDNELNLRKKHVQYLLAEVSNFDNNNQIDEILDIINEIH